VDSEGAKGAEGREAIGVKQKAEVGKCLKLPLASTTEIRHFSDVSMLTLTPTAARGNLSELLRRALKGDDIGIVVDGKIVALRPVAVESMDYTAREYRATAVALDQFEQRTHGKIEKARKEGKLHDLTGDIDCLLAAPAGAPPMTPERIKQILEETP
jgi:antitoxin (DNA-binding transcriptional repressor) of toxin-antitoxin stability system